MSSSSLRGRGPAASGRMMTLRQILLSLAFTIVLIRYFIVLKLFRLIK